jgi:hypothetical protein
MKFTKVFWIALGIMIIVFILPTLLTYNAPSYDGSRIYGFPLRFYSVGGLCLTGEQCSFFSSMNLIIDLIILIGLPILINYLFLKFKK